MKHEARMVQMNAASRGLNIIIGSHFGRAASGNHLAHDYASITCQGCDQNRSSVTPRVFILPFIVPCFMKERHLSYQSITLTSDIQWPIHDKVFPLKKRHLWNQSWPQVGHMEPQKWWFPIPIQGCHSSGEPTLHTKRLIITTGDHLLHGFPGQRCRCR